MNLAAVRMLRTPVPQSTPFCHRDHTVLAGSEWLTALAFAGVFTYSVSNSADVLDEEFWRTTDIHTRK